MAIRQLTLPKGSLTSPSTSRLAHKETSCRSPRVPLHDNQPIKLFWFSNPIGGPHTSCVSLTESRNLLTGTNTVLVHTVFEPTPSNDFPGLYTGVQHPHQPISTARRSRIYRSTVYLSLTHHRGSSSSIPITDATKLGDGLLYSWTVHATDKSHPA
ncbi:hypothetical protein BDR05DRAFT_739198 [Suillus weaverae]|nr:hypothetical protein BDR05DRAFT_739198 [Suillus weaverae]